MEMLSILGIGIIATVIAVVLRQYKPEFALLVSIAAGLFIFLRITSDIIPIMDKIRSIIERVNMPAEYAGVLFKSLGLCFITQIGCDICKDAGETAISSKIEIAGKIAVLVISLPLFEQVLSIVYMLVGG